jgi:Ras-related protein Rab-11A
MINTSTGASGSGAVESPDFAYKLVLLGDSNVGKTNFLKRFRDDEFDHNTKPTIGVELYSKRVAIKAPSTHVVKASIWDTAGQERYRAITPTYYRNAAGIFLVYDVTNQESFDHIPVWLEEVRKCVDESSVLFMLIGNKIDLGYTRVVSEEQGKAFAQQHGMFFYETSAKDNTNVQQAFEVLINEIHAKHTSNLTAGGASGANLPKSSQPIRIGQTGGGGGSLGAKSGCCGGSK